MHNPLTIPMRNGPKPMMDVPMNEHTGGMAARIAT